MKRGGSGEVVFLPGVAREWVEVGEGVSLGKVLSRGVLAVLAVSLSLRFLECWIEAVVEG